MRPGPKPVISTYAHSLGITKRQLDRMGGMERVKSMSEDGRTILVNIAKRSRLLCGQELTLENRKAAEK
jgi:hypothetical protein